jgi:hypothetical protein
MDESEKAWIRGFSNALAEMHRLLRVGYNSSGVCSVAKGHAYPVHALHQLDRR